jgi:hypothetical protein
MYGFSNLAKNTCFKVEINAANFILTSDGLNFKTVGKLDAVAVLVIEVACERLLLPPKVE